MCSSWARRSPRVCPGEGGRQGVSVDASCRSNRTAARSSSWPGCRQRSPDRRSQLAEGPEVNFFQSSAEEANRCSGESWKEAGGRKLAVTSCGERRRAALESFGNLKTTRRHVGLKCLFLRFEAYTEAVLRIPEAGNDPAFGKVARSWQRKLNKQGNRRVRPDFMQPCIKLESRLERLTGG